MDHQVVEREEGKRMDRWDGNIHYYDYTEESIKRYQDMDALKVAEAFIYSEDWRHSLRVVVLVTAPALKTGSVTLEDAIRGGTRLRDELALRNKDAATLLKQDSLLLYLWNRERIQ
jgi:hypothetical protein